LNTNNSSLNNKICVAVFAHNEERNIERCLESIMQSTQRPDLLQVTVLINGCNDRTADVVNALSEMYPQINSVEIGLGDKSNAWNNYVYSGLDFAVNHYFVDGDNWLPALSLDKLEIGFDTSRYWGIAPIPIGIKESLRKFMIEHKFISGNCYGVSGEFLESVVSNDFRIPQGFIGDDSLVMYLLQEGVSANYIVKGVKVVETTGAVIPRVPISISTIGFMHRRYKRYALRHMQQEVLYYLGRNDRLNELPASTSNFRNILKEIGLKPIFVMCGIQTLYHPFAYFKIMKKNRAHSVA
jgi:cellulose synthase/poly-beta-1,6-N-acetylglucosamine synthase-like glycosyltransferase